MLVSLARVIVIYTCIHVIKEIASGLGQLMGVTRNRMRARSSSSALQTNRK